MPPMFLRRLARRLAPLAPRLVPGLLVPLAVGAGAGAGGCFSEAPTFMGEPATGTGPVVRFDVFNKPFAEIPLPNDFATRYDETSPTRRRLNASVLAGPTAWEQATRAELNKLSGWGTLAPLAVSFTAPIDPEVIIKRHHGDRFDTRDDAVLVLDVTRGSPGFCQAVPLDLGQGNYPQVLHETNVFESDPRAGLQTLVFDETEEDTNANGVLDPGEDTDGDGVLDHPNTRDGRPMHPGSQVLDFYERETNTLIMKPVMPMREATTYAAVLTKRLVSPAGESVRSPFGGVHHVEQGPALAPLPECLGRHGLALPDVAFAWTFTTQSISNDYRLVRDGLYGVGPLAKLATDFPATPSRLDDVHDPGPGVTMPKLAPMSDFIPLALDLFALTGSSKEEAAVFEATMKTVDYVVAGAIKSPQFFPRSDAAGKALPLYKQVWNLDAPPRSEEVPYWLFVPKKRSGPVPVAIFIHGHSGSKFDALPFAGLLASYGIATLGLDGPSHGVGVTSVQLGLVRGFFKKARLAGLGESLILGRAADLTGDGNVDSGDDFWTAYVFHTRDMVRQTIVDAMQVVRTLRGFDGKARWAFDPAGRGAPGLAGDFDGDGVVDVGGAAPLHVIGGSLGGITGGVFAGLEPEVDDAVSIVPGGMLSEIGTRSTLRNIRNAMVLRALGPIFYAEKGALMARVNLGQTQDIPVKLHDLPALAPKDTVVLRNGKTGEHRCAPVQPSGTFRVAIAMDEGDPLELSVYRGPAAPRPRDGCVVPAEAPYVKVTTFGYEVAIGDKLFAAGSPLVAPTDGFGQRRATPDLRRFLGLSQIALDAADPMNWAPYWDGTRTMTYGTGATVETRVLMAPSVGDPGVAIAGGVAMARAAGFVEYDRDDPRYGKPQNQVLIDTGTVEGTYRLGRHRDSKGNPVLMDVESFASIVPAPDGFDVPRLAPPLRLVRKGADGGFSGVLFPMLSPKGKHGFASPDPTKPFDLGTYLLNIMGRYMQTSGRELSLDKCQATSACPWETLPLK
ncbi:MAG: hypothetical protein IPF92_24125 [Myxococcales bacterium]|nr:hypothetical protein [Myxococcales bacterium]